MATWELVKDTEISEFLEIVRAHKGAPAGRKYLSYRMNISPLRIVSIVGACKREGYHILAKRLENSNEIGYLLGNECKKSLKQLSIGDKIEYFDSHFEDTSEFLKYWKEFDVIAETDCFWVCETDKKIRTCILKKDLFSGKVRVIGGAE